MKEIYIKHVWLGLKRWGKIIYMEWSSCWSLLPYAISGCEMFQKRHGLLRTWLLKSAGKFFPDSLMIALCQITNWISSHWRRLHFLCPHLIIESKSPFCLTTTLTCYQLYKVVHLHVRILALLLRHLTCIVALVWAGSAPICWCSSVWRWARMGRGCWWTPWWCP